MATFRTSQCQDGDEVSKCHEQRCQGIKRRLKNLNTRKSTSRRILTGILLKNSELKPNLSSKRSREGSSWSMRSRIRDGPLENLWGGGGTGEVQKKIRARENLISKNSCTPLTLRNIHARVWKKNHTRNLIKKKNSCGSKIPLPPYPFLMVRP